LQQRDLRSTGKRKLICCKWDRSNQKKKGSLPFWRGGLWLNMEGFKKDNQWGENENIFIFRGGGRDSTHKGGLKGRISTGKKGSPQKEVR